MKYIKTFDSHNEYLDFKENGEIYYPNILVCRDEEHVHASMRCPSVLKFTACEPPFEPVRSETDYAAIIKLMKINSNNEFPFLYSINDGEWQECEYTEYDSQTTAGTVYGIYIVLENVGDYVKLKSNGPLLVDDGSVEKSGNGGFDLNGYQFSIDGYVRAEGDITSLLNGEGGDCELYGNALSYLFAYCDGLLSAPNLPSTNIGEYCYECMFLRCENLLEGPEILPATTLSDGCYQYMFQGCTSLTAAPELPATTLASNCYSNMFKDCSSLAYIKALFLTNPEEQQVAKSTYYPYTYDWTNGVSYSGFFEGNPSAMWCCVGPNGIPNDWETNMNCDTTSPALS